MPLLPLYCHMDGCIAHCLLVTPLVAYSLFSLAFWWWEKQVADALEGKCRVFKLDSDEHSDMASALNVSTISRRYFIMLVKKKQLSPCLLQSICKPDFVLHNVPVVHVRTHVPCATVPMYGCRTLCTAAPVGQLLGGDRNSTLCQCAIQLKNTPVYCPQPSSECIVL